MLNALEALPSGRVKTPRLYLQLVNTQVFEDFQNMIGLNSFLVNSLPTQSLSTSIGHALGAWTRCFHTWASEPAQAGLRNEIKKNEPMRQLKRRITYDIFIPILEKFPEVLGSHRKALEDVKVWATGVNDSEIIHGDFWSGK
jgi:hypothetical protein